MIEVLYSTPTFVLHGYYAILAFTASILPQRLNTIQSLLILPSKLDYPDPDEDDFPQYKFYRYINFPRFLHLHFSFIRNLKIYNTNFSSGKVFPKQLSAFGLVTMVMCGMPALQELHMKLVCQWDIADTFCRNRDLEDDKYAREVTRVIEMLKKKALEGVDLSITFAYLPKDARLIDASFLHAIS